MTLLKFLALALFLISFSCKKETPPEPPNGPKPGKRDYVWTVDTIAYPGSFQTTMRDIWASAPNNVYIVGHNDQNRGQMYRYDGASWQPVRLAASDGGTIIGPFDLSAIYGFGPNDIYAVGQHIYQNPTPPPNFLDSSLIIHFDGSQWREVQLPRRGRQLIGIGTTGPSTLWAGGSYGTLYHYDSGSWQFYQADTLLWFSEFDFDQNGHYALAYTPGPLIQSPSRYFLLRLVEPDWSIVDSFSVSSGYVATFGNVDMSNIGGTLYSAGDGVFKKNSSTWLKVLDSSPYPIYGLGGTRADHVFAVGEATSIYHFNGSDWYKYSQFSRDGVYCGAAWSTEDEVFVAGTDGNRTFVYHGE